MKRNLIILLILLSIAAFVRLYKISDYMHFLGDEGRDVLVVKRMIIDHKITFIGPITSVGSMYLGPIYYYFMIPFLWLFNMNPVGPAVMIALSSVATVYLIYSLSVKFFDLKTAVVSSLLYALSPMVINYSRFSWNPNAVPLFGLLIIYGIQHLLTTNKARWPLIIGLSLGVVFQLHYLALIFIPIIIISLISYKKFTVKNLLLIIVGSIIVLAPFIAFEFKHHFPNTQTAFRFLTQPGNNANLSINVDGFFLSVSDLTLRSFWRILVIEDGNISRFVIFVTFFTTILMFLDKSYRHKKPLSILIIWFLITMLFLGAYQGAKYDYYLVVLFTLPALLFGVVFSYCYTKRKEIKYFTIFLACLILVFQLINSPLLKEPNRLLQSTKDRSQFIFKQIGDKPYNFALITESNSDHAYIYFLELWGKTPIEILNPDIDPERKSVTDQLFVLCETKECKPLGNPLWEVAGFGRAEIAGQWEIDGANVFKLVHYIQ